MQTPHQETALETAIRVMQIPHNRPRVTRYRLTREQRRALYNLYQRSPYATTQTFLQFRRTAEPNALLGCVLIPFCGMWVGIEPDGYTHS